MLAGELVDELKLKRRKKKKRKLPLFFYFRARQNSIVPHLLLLNTGVAGCLAFNLAGGMALSLPILDTADKFVAADSDSAAAAATAATPLVRCDALLVSDDDVPVVVPDDGQLFTLPPLLV